MRYLALTCLFAFVVPVAEARAAEPSWLDAASLTGWNQPAQRVPGAVRPGVPDDDPRCAEQWRVPSRSRADLAVVKAGWDLIGPLQVFGATELVTGASGVDGMCRPLGYQGFVFVDGRFAGTLSPRPMDARTDGVAIAIHLAAPDRLTVEYARYTDRDPLCCPSATTAVTFAVRRVRAGAYLEPIDLSTSPNTGPAVSAPPPPPAQPGAKPDRQLANTYWKLTRLGAQDSETHAGQREPYLILRADGATLDGSGGCNRLSGTYRLEGALLSFGPLATTKMMCAEAIEQERRFLQTLAMVRGWRVKGDDLELLDVHGAVAAAFVAVDLP